MSWVAATFDGTCTRVWPASCKAHGSMSCVVLTNVFCQLFSPTREGFAPQDPISCRRNQVQRGCFLARRHPQPHISTIMRGRNRCKSHTTGLSPEMEGRGHMVAVHQLFTRRVRLTRWTAWTGTLPGTSLCTSSAGTTSSTMKRSPTAAH